MKTVQNQVKPVSKQTWRNKVTYVKKNWQLYLFFLMPGLLLTIIFKYLPMGGLLIAFEDYNVIKGVLGSPWVGLEYFRRFLSSPDFMNYLMNTLKLSIYGLLWGFPVPIILALLMNRIQKTGIKKKVQLLIDEDVLKGEFFACHPCINTSSLRFRTKDLMEKVIPAMGHEPKMVRL